MKAVQWPSHVTVGIHWWVNRKLLVMLMELGLLLHPLAKVWFEILSYGADIEQYVTFAIQNLRDLKDFQINCNNLLILYYYLFRSIQYFNWCKSHFTFVHNLFKIVIAVHLPITIDLGDLILKTEFSNSNSNNNFSNHLGYVKKAQIFNISQ